jgi:hypothetical protein
MTESEPSGQSTTESARPATPATLPRVMTAEERAAQRRRNQTYWMVALAVGMGLFFLLLPYFYRAHYNFLLWAEGFMERIFATSFLSGKFPALTETPKPLWNLFWLLSSLPNRLYLFIVIMIGVVFYLFLDVSRRLTGSIGYGIVASLVAVFGYKDVLNLFLNGNWTVPMMLLGLLFLGGLLSRRWGLAAAAIGLAGLIRPESWFLAAYLLFYIVFLREKLRWFHFLPLLAPLLWAYYDFRLSGDWLFSYRSTAAYAFVTGLSGVNLVNFWPRLVPDVLEATGVVVPLLALVGIALRAANIARTTRERKALTVLLDPLLATALLPLIASWLMSIQGNIIVMRRFFYFSLALFALYAVLLPFELVRWRKVANRRLVIALACAPVVLVGLVRAPTVIRDSWRETRVTESKMAAIVGLCEEVARPLVDLNKYKHVLIPFRRQAQFRAFLTDSVIKKLISYRELSLAVTSTQYAMMGEPVEVPPGSPPGIRGLVESKKQFVDFLPALALWVPDDERHFIDAFAFDDPDYFHRNYIDKGRYGFRIIGSALDSLGLIYDVREITPDMIRAVYPPGESLPPLHYELKKDPER